MANYAAALQAALTDQAERDRCSWLAEWTSPPMTPEKLKWCRVWVDLWVDHRRLLRLGV